MDRYWNTIINSSVRYFWVLQKKAVIFLLVCAFLGRINAQSYATQRNQVFIINVLGNAIMGGVGGAINKNKEEKIYKAFIRNFLKGGVGGLVKYTAKYESYYLGNFGNAQYAPIDRLYFFLGHSFVVNASLNRKLLDTYYCNFYGIDFRVSLAAEQKIRARVSLATLGSAIYFGLSGFEFDLFRTLEYGNLFFSARHNGSYFGLAGFNCIAIDTRGSNINTSLVPHETVHTYQMYDMFSLASCYDKKEKAFVQKNKICRILSNYFVADYQALFFSTLYLLQPKPTYFKNYFEFEAEHFKARQYIER